MGQRISSLFTGLSRFFEYPIKRKPICFYRQQDFTATGKPRQRAGSEQVHRTEYDRLVEVFYERLAEKRHYNQKMMDKDTRWTVQKVLKRFPGWNEVTIANLHSLFLLFDNRDNGMLGFDDFCAILENLGDENEMEIRKDKFSKADTDNDGWINYDEFLSLVYNFNRVEDGNLDGLALICQEVAQNIHFISSLTVGEQLEYGLF